MSRQTAVPDDLDRLLHDFFQAELPDPWPACPAAAPSAPLAVAGASASRGRLVLAASVLLLLAGSLALPTRVGDAALPTDPGLGKPEATRRGPDGKPRIAPLTAPRPLPPQRP